MLKVVYSNDMLQLAASLAEQQKTSPLPPLEAETVIVQSNELARWLSLYLAQTHSIASHIEFPYPSAYIWALFRRLFPEVPKESAFNKDAMTWRIFDLLKVCRDHSEFAAVAYYLGEHDDMVKRFGLALRIADSFDQYLMYRPDWLQTWEQDNADLPHWQAILWQRLTAGGPTPAPHRANLLTRLKQTLTTTTTRPVGLPQRLSIFGLSALPPVYLELYALMAKFCDITIYFLSPCEAYWGDLLAPKQAGQQTLDFGDSEIENVSGHPLLASLGKQGQDFFEQLQQCDHESDSLFILPESETVLAQLQRDIAELNDPSQSNNKSIMMDDDDSIQCHVCHSAMREVEVLHDQLLRLLECHPELSPTDIVVMTPDIDVYADAIDAVFGTAEPQLFIPYSISGASGSQQSPIISAFDRLLALPESRFEVDSIVALLECEAIRLRFSLQEEDVALIRQWCRETQIKWGLSGKDKATFDLPTNDANSWRAGLDRLLLGYAFPLSDDEGHWQLFDNQLGVDGIRGERAQVMAQLCAFVDNLDKARQQLKQVKTAKQWQQILLALLNQFFAPHFDSQRDERDILSLTQVFDSLVTSVELAESEQSIPISVICAFLKNHVEASVSEHRFMGHGVTFCGMVPMRSIPFGVVCLIGMNDSSFPRRQPQLGFDLLAQDFRKGDRSRREDDRYLFLEAILSAQQHLYLSYVGRSIVDNSPIPPSVLVSDLRDVLRQGFEAIDGEDVWSKIVVEHPLQAFSTRYFNGQSDTLVSYQSIYCPPNEQEKDIINWADNALPEPDASWKNVSLNQLIQFYRHPTRYLLQQRLGLYFDQDEAVLDSREPFALDGLTNWQCEQDILTQRRQGNDVDVIQASLHATGRLPQGHIGEELLSKQIDRVDNFLNALPDEYSDELIMPLTIGLTIGDFTVVGELHNVTSKGIYQCQMGRMKASGLLARWCEHVILNCLKPEGVSLETRWLTSEKDDKDKSKVKLKEAVFTELAEPEAILLTLLEQYWSGCQKPLAFFTETSFAYAKAAAKSGKADPIKAIHHAWFGNDHFDGEGDDDYYHRVYPTLDFDDACEQLALTIYEPMLAHLTERTL